MEPEIVAPRSQEPQGFKVTQMSGKSKITKKEERTKYKYFCTFKLNVKGNKKEIGYIIEAENIDKVNELETKTTTTNTLNQKLTENKKLQEQQTKQLQNKVNELEEELKRFSKLSFNPINADSIITENYKQTQYTDEELQLLDALIKK